MGLVCRAQKNSELAAEARVGQRAAPLTRQATSELAAEARAQAAMHLRAAQQQAQAPVGMSAPPEHPDSDTGAQESIGVQMSMPNPEQQAQE